MNVVGLPTAYTRFQIENNISINVMIHKKAMSGKTPAHGFFAVRIKLQRSADANMCKSAEMCANPPIYLDNALLQEYNEISYYKYNEIGYCKNISIDLFL